MRIALAVLFPLVLAGCGLPPAITVISYLLDGVSLFSTGKTVSDHALSIAMEQDCKVWRVVQDQSVCRDLLPGEKNTLIAEAEKWQAGGEIVGQQEPGDQPAVAALIQTISADPVVIPNYLDGLVTGFGGIIRSEVPLETQPAAFGMRMDGAFGYAGANKPKPRQKPTASEPPPLARLKPGWNPPQDPADTLAAGRRAAEITPAAGNQPASDKPAELVNPRVLVLGSYGERANALRAALKWRAMGASITPSGAGAARLYRVVTSPVSGKDYVSELRRIRSAGIKGAWALRLCGGDAKPGACVSSRASVAE